MPPIRVLPPMEMRRRAPFLREVWIWARYGEDASDAKDPWGTGQVEEGYSSHSQNCQCMTPFFN